jgi:hypothetical protein
MYVSVKTGPHTHTKCGLRFPSQHHISYKRVIAQPIIYIYIYICLLKVLCPVRRPITALDYILLKDNNRSLIVLIFVNDVSICTDFLALYIMLVITPVIHIAVLRINVDLQKTFPLECVSIFMASLRAWLQFFNCYHRQIKTKIKL